MKIGINSKRGTFGSTSYYYCCTCTSYRMPSNLSLFTLDWSFSSSSLERRRREKKKEVMSTTTGSQWRGTKTSISFASSETRTHIIEKERGEIRRATAQPHVYTYTKCVYRAVPLWVEKIWYRKHTCSDLPKSAMNAFDGFPLVFIVDIGQSWGIIKYIRDYSYCRGESVAHYCTSLSKTCLVSESHYNI